MPQLCYLLPIPHTIYGGVTMKSRKEDFTKKIADELQFPQTAVSDIFHIELKGNSDATIEGCRGILDYDETYITINLGDSTVRFSGAELEISSFFDGRAVIKGTIASVDFSN